MSSEIIPHSTEVLASSCGTFFRPYIQIVEESEIKGSDLELCKVFIKINLHKTSQVFPLSFIKLEAVQFQRVNFG